MTNLQDQFDWSTLVDRSGSLSHQFRQQLERAILDGSLPPGTRLLSEREFAEKARLSRTTVREALRDLQLRGLIDRRPGRGTIVTMPDRPELRASALTSDRPNQHLLREVMDLRATIEPPIAQRAAARRNEFDLQSIETVLREAETIVAARPMVDADKLSALDVEFHTAIARASRNSMLDRLMVVTNEWMSPARQRALQTPRRSRESVLAHRAIYEAILAGDPDQAHAAMADHIGEVFDAIGLT